MNELIAAAGTCFLFGMLTVLHPCPFATNLASISFLSGSSTSTSKKRRIIGLFVLGYASAYLLLSVLIISGMYTIPGLSYLLQYYFLLLLGPLLIVVGMLQADLIKVNRLYKDRLFRWVVQREWPGISAFPMGLILALSFCPATAAIFFGILIPMAIRYEQFILFPGLYAMGALVPLVIISILILRGIRMTRNRFIQKNMSAIVGWVLIAIGVVISIRQIYMPYF